MATTCIYNYWYYSLSRLVGNRGWKQKKLLAICHDPSLINTNGHKIITFLQNEFNVCTEYANPLYNGKEQNEAEGDKDGLPF